jgi:hypothetical protein
MVEPPRKRVFISYARKDAAPLATLLQQSLEPDCEVWLDTQRIEGGASWTVEIENAIDNCDTLLALLTSGSYVSDICRAEQLRALRRHKQVIPLLAESGADRPLHLETAIYRDFTATRPAPEQLRHLRDDIRTGRDAAVLPEKFQTTRYETVPPLPRNYIERPDALESVRRAVILDEPGPSIALTALRGMGGLGKTILAQALSHDEAVQQAFPDGIAWTTVGKDAGHNLKERMQEVRRALGDKPDPGETERQCTNLYRTLLGNKAALVIVDDIWRPADIEPFLAESRRSLGFVDGLLWHCNKLLHFVRRLPNDAGIGCPAAVAAGLDLGHREGAYVRSGGRKVMWMFNGSAACISLTPQLHARYQHCNFHKVCTVVVSLETVSGHRVLAGPAMPLQQIAPFCSSK